MKTRLLITGGCGFVGHHVIEHFLKNSDWEIITLDRYSYSGTAERLKHINIWEEVKHRVTFIHHDLKSEINKSVANKLLAGGPINHVVHIAANSHVDRSIENPREFVLDNVLGTCNLLEFVRHHCDSDLLKRVLYFSTDEVFGCKVEGYSKEWDTYKSRNPYAATKAGGEELAASFCNTYKMPIIITHTMNVFGERQHPEKFISKCIRYALNGLTLSIHSNPEKTKAGVRAYVHARNVAQAVHFLLEKSTVGDKYNIVGERETDNLELALMIADILGKSLKYEMVDFHSSRPGHDLRYALDGTKLNEMGFEYPSTFKESLTKTIQWMIRNPEWL